MLITVNMKKAFRHIRKELLKIGIKIDFDSVAKFPSAGIANEIYTAGSSRGKLIIHISTLEEQKVQKVHEKVYWLSRFLQHHKAIPATHVLLAGMLSSSKCFTVQSFVKGEVLGDRIIKKGNFVNRYFFSDKTYQNQLQAVLANMHEIMSNGYGFLEARNGILYGRHRSWLAFLRHGSERWLENIYKYQKRKEMTRKEYEGLWHKVAKFFEKHRSHMTCARGRLLHGDMIHPGNVIVRKGKIAAVLDFEWACSGDPPWDFAFMAKDDLGRYFECLEKKGAAVDRKEFQLRRKLYRVPWLLWGANVHAKGGILRDFLLREFRKELDKLC